MPQKWVFCGTYRIWRKRIKKLDIGNSDFKSLIENDNYYVDKSLFIQELIDIQKQVILIPRPRRFG
ncbi:MAG TPA: AAA family ATPase [Leptospiraceae bacterium]|nr:AAA family ATPase [Leptospiraceae bacterium]HMY66435.1 AAA family ATPase [Leptospiraceae bacterium]HMZ59721.1 AAA family ATPase [Leptospiraceae bacterium]HNF13702.1 AAA family ATPase [Leptospiraceae bacterium]HNF25877.1 AAA family ATPase [Leptospiraceae bacterium]